MRIHFICLSNRATSEKMASDKASASDGGDSVIQDVPDFHKEYMKAKLIDFLRETKDFSVQIIHSRDKPAQMIFNIGTKAGNFCIYYTIIDY